MYQKIDFSKLASIEQLDQVDENMKRQIFNMAEKCFQLIGTDEDEDS